MTTTTAAAAKTEKREDLIRTAAEYDAISNEVIRRAIIEENRFDLLATQVLGLEMEQVHLELLAFALQYPESLHLAFRGCGKTTSLTIVYAIGRALQNPELRILIASKSLSYAKTILREIKGYLEDPRLTDIFGDQRSPDKWEETEINLLGKTRVTKEATFTALGAEGAITGRHFDIILVDDLVDEDNCRTKSQRDRIKTFYYKTLDPCLEPGGERKVIGTRYHSRDLYSWLSENEFADFTQIIPALFEYKYIDKDTGEEETRYESSSPVRFPVTFLLNKRDTVPTMVWLTQWQCEVSRFQGKVFPPKYFEEEGFYYTGDVPERSIVFQGVDPAVTEDTKNDCFALLTVAVDGEDVYVVDYDNTRMEFPKQPDHCIKKFDEHDPVRQAIESNAFQKALAQQILHRRPDLKGRIVPVPTGKDKLTRALKLTSYFEAGRIHMKPEHTELVEQLLEFPDGEHDDLFDALDIAVQAGTRMRVRRKRKKEFGVL